jgi:hypothetical protein
LSGNVYAQFIFDLLIILFYFSEIAQIGLKLEIFLPHLSVEDRHATPYPASVYN